MLRQNDMVENIKDDGEHAWLEWLQRGTDYYNQVFRWTDPYYKYFGKSTPPSKTGLIAYADGVNWKPNGTGAAGYWYYNGSTWIKLG